MRANGSRVWLSGWLCLSSSLSVSRQLQRQRMRLRPSTVQGTLHQPAAVCNALAPAHAAHANVSVGHMRARARVHGLAAQAPATTTRRISSSAS